MSHDQRPTDSRSADSHADTPLFDPRHSPVFQRGYDPEADAAPVPSRAPARPSTRLFSGRERVAGQERQVSHAVDHAVGHPVDHLIDHRVAHPATPLPGPVAAPEQPPVGQEEWTDDQPDRNPFIVALWAIAIGLIVVAVSFQWWALSRNNNGYSGTEMPIEYVLQQLSWSISTPMISTGMLTIVGLIVWKALRWQEQQGAAVARVPLGTTNE